MKFRFLNSGDCIFFVNYILQNCKLLYIEKRKQEEK